MNKFFTDKSRSIDDINASYAGKGMDYICKVEDERKDILRDEIDTKHEEFVSNGRGRMLTVQKLIDYLKTQDPNACILAYEPNSFAYIELMPDLPNADICTVAEDRALMREHLKQWYRGTDDADDKVEKEIERTYRYAKDNDIIMRFD